MGYLSVRRGRMAENGSQKVFVPDLFVRAKEVTFDVVLGELGLLDQLKIVGDEIRGKCPLCGGERSFSANPVKGVFNCFRCHKKKDVVDFVTFYRKVEPKQAAEWLVSLLPPAQDVPDEKGVENEISALSLSGREVRLLHVIARANARCVAAMFSGSFAGVVEQLEEMAEQIVTEEIAKEFPDTVFSEAGK